MFQLTSHLELIGDFFRVDGRRCFCKSLHGTKQNLGQSNVEMIF
jgi:hypothetical protein